MRDSWDIEFTEAIGEWWSALPASAQEAISHDVELLARLGPALGRPWVDSVKGSRHANMKELRTRHRASAYRVLFAFDPRRTGVLLLGGDAGPGRWSLRTDSMILVSIEPVTGDTAMISIPRNLSRMPFPPGTPLAEQFPDGFTDLANAVYTYADQRRELAGGGDDAGAQAIKQGVAMGLPERESWRMSFGLLVTLVWLYLEFLRLFAIIASGRD